MSNHYYNGIGNIARIVILSQNNIIMMIIIIVIVSWLKSQVRPHCLLIHKQSHLAYIWYDNCGSVDNTQTIKSLYDSVTNRKGSFNLFTQKTRYNLYKVIHSSYNINTNELYITFAEGIICPAHLPCNCVIENIFLLQF